MEVGGADWPGGAYIVFRSVIVRNDGGGVGGAGSGAATGGSNEGASIVEAWGRSIDFSSDIGDDFSVEGSVFSDGVVYLILKGGVLAKFV